MANNTFNQSIGVSEMTKFETGKTYYTRSVADYDTIVRVTVAKRTDKTIVTAAGDRLKIKVWDDVEQVKPWGSFSMAPIVSADRLLTDAA
jgi:hypothetical protein